MGSEEGLIQGGGTITRYSQVRKEKVRKYQRKVDIRKIMRGYLESPDAVRNDALCRETADKMAKKLKTCAPFVGSYILKELKRVQNEDHFEAVMDKVWSFAEERRILIIA